MNPPQGTDEQPRAPMAHNNPEANCSSVRLEFGLGLELPGIHLDCRDSKGLHKFLSNPVL